LVITGALLTVGAHVLLDIPYRTAVLIGPALAREALIRDDGDTAKIERLIVRVRNEHYASAASSAEG